MLSLELVKVSRNENSDGASQTLGYTNIIPDTQCVDTKKLVIWKS